MRLITLIVTTAALFPLCHAQKFRFVAVSESVIEQREKDAPGSELERAARIRELFAEAGCSGDRLSEQPLATPGAGNVVCRLAGKGKETIIVGANYNQSSPDNWTGASLLSSLFQSLAGKKRHHTFLFVAFADSTHDLAGAEFFARHMTPEDVERTAAMINLDALGFSPTKISSSTSDKNLVESFVAVMYVLRQMGSQVDLSGAVHVDSEPFALRQIPQITIHSLTHDIVAAIQPQEQHLVAAPDTDFAHIETGFRPDRYYNSYRLISGYLAYLDETLKSRKHK
jgi:hypothetical protein